LPREKIKLLPKHVLGQVGRDGDSAASFMRIVCNLRTPGAVPDLSISVNF
jgi:hypothetical protein